MGWGGWKKIGNGFRKAAPAAATYFANPLAAQDIFGSAFLGSGGDVGAATSATGDPLTYASTNPKDLAAFNAALLAGAAGGAGVYGAGLSAGAASGGIGSLSAGGLSAIGATAGTAAAAGSYSAMRDAGLKDSTPSGAEGIPPDLMDMYKNDPERAKQFMRLRKSAAMLGRAGTIKAKGSSSLGGDQPLGTNLALTGA